MRGKDKSWHRYPLGSVQPGSLTGSLVVIEGTDGVGRSTQIEQLRPWLEVEGHAVVTTRWARSPLLSDTIERAKGGHELTVTTWSLLYAADFADRLEQEIIPALRAGFVVLADRYVYTVFARTAVMGADRAWTRELFGHALVPDLILYLQTDVDHLIPRVIEGKGMNYWESGMHLSLGTDLFDSFRTYQRRLIREYNRLAKEFHFSTIDARQPIEAIQAALRHRISAHLHARRRRAPARAGRPARKTAAVA